MNAAAVIPIKTNNQRLPGKNTKILNGKPLYEYLFETVTKAKGLDKIYVSSSDDKILDIASDQGFETIRRPIHLNSPETSGNDLLRFEIEHIQEENICQLFVTLPFIEATTIDKCISTIKTESVDSLLPVYEVYDRFWFSDVVEDITPVNHDPSILVGTQYMKPLYREAGFYVFKRSAFIREQKRVTTNFKHLIFDERQFIDIDTELDFFYAESLARWGQK